MHAHARPSLRRGDASGNRHGSHIIAEHPALGQYRLACDERPDLLFTENETNIVRLEVSELTGLGAAEMVRRAAQQGVLMNATGKRTLRAVTHLEVSAAQIERALEAAADVLTG